MAKTVDEIVLKTSVEGAQTLDQVNAKLASIDESAKKTATAMNQVQGGVRNVAYQIQDLAVQISMGTNVFMALGQQLPQLLSGFGTMGVVIGAVAAVAIPALQAGLKAAGIDMRNLKEMTDDYAKANEAFIAAQKQNQTTLAGLGTSYGSLTAEAKRYFEIKEKLNEARAERASIDTVKELTTEYGKLSRESVAAARAQGQAIGAGGGAGQAAAEIGIWFRQWRKGLTEEQGYAVADMLKTIDAASPEKTVEAISNVLIYLEKIGPEAKSFKESFEKTVEPLMKINDELIRQKTNIAEAAKQASEFNAKLLNIQSSYIGRIGDARRAFDPVYALQLEKEQKLAEVRAQFAEKNKDNVNRSKEQLAAEGKIIAEISDKQKDLIKAQQETFYAQQLNNEAKDRGLRVQRNINNLQLEQINSLDYDKKLEEDILKNIEAQIIADFAILELSRKRQINAEQEAMLLRQSADNRKLADQVSLQNIEKIRIENERSIRLQVEGLATQNSIKEKSIALEEKIFGMSTLRQETEKKLFDIQNSRDREIQNINNNSRLSDAEKLDALIRINEQYGISKDLAEQEYQYRKRLSESFQAGAYDRVKQITESFDNFKTAGMAVDSVWNNMSSALDNFVETGKFRFGDFARSIIFDLEKIALKSAVIGLFKSYGLGDIFTLPGRAAGGPVSSNTPYMVGEAGPELFIPNSSGNIVPNGKLGGGGTTIINNISAIDAKSVAQLFAENRMTLFGNVEQARRELPMRTR
jgi:hypothetical protein